ncbi:hypothetical protein JXM67_10410 [candidate division WOR-3 bacterium]|nr:hypothetical protein [candidate division WOR-3 bacterium]
MSSRRRNGRVGNGLFAYVNNNNLQIKSPSREVYLEWDRDDPEKNVTELQYSWIEKIYYPRP